MAAGLRPRSRYNTVFGRRYILIRPLTLWPAVAVDVIGFALLKALQALQAWFGRGSSEPRSAAGPVARILAIRLDHIGDVLITTPALRLLRQSFPDARLDVLAGSWAADLLRDDPDVDRVRVFDARWFGGKAGLRAVLGLLAELRRERYDLVVDFRGDLRHLLIGRLTGARRLAGWGIRGGGFLLSEPAVYDERAHEVDRAVAIVRALGPGERDAGGLQITVRPEDEQEAGRLFAEVGVRSDRLRVALCPTSRNPTRWWRGDRFAEVARRLVERYQAEILVFGDAAAADLRDTLLGPGRAGIRSFVGRTSLRVFAAALERVDLIVSVESSPIHFASALEKPIVTIFGGSSLPEHWGPYRTSHRIVHREVPCSPCHYLRCPLPEVLCMDAISADDVSQACDELLAEIASRDAELAARMQLSR